MFFFDYIQSCVCVLLGCVDIIWYFNKTMIGCCVAVFLDHTLYLSDNNMIVVCYAAFAPEHENVKIW